MASGTYLNSDLSRYDDPYYDEYYDPYGRFQTQEPAAPNVEFYNGGVILAGWAPRGDDWEPVYKGNDGNYYINGGVNGQSGMVPWSGMSSNLKTGDGSGGKPTWKPGDPEPATAGETYPESVRRTNAAASVVPAPGTSVVSSGGGSRPRAAVAPAAQPFYFPEFEAPAYTPIDPFQAPSLADAQNEPGYAFAMEQGRKALENSAAARGTLRTGGTMKDLFSWGHQFGEQNYSQVYARAASDWERNNKRNLDTYDIAYKGALDRFAPKERAAGLVFDDLYRRWRDSLDAETRIATAGSY